MNNIIYLFVLFLISNVVIADASLSFKGAFRDEDNNKMHVNMTRKKSVSYEQLEKFWDSLGKVTRKDSNNQPWKTVTIEQMRKLVGDIPDQYLLINPIVKLVNANQTNEHYEIIDYKLERRKVTGASLYRWGCDESLSAVVHIGKWPTDDVRSEGPMVVPYQTEMGKIVLTQHDTSFVPETILQQAEKPFSGFSLLGIDSGFAATEIKIPKPSWKYIGYQIFLFVKENDKIKKIEFERAFPIC